MITRMTEEEFYGRPVPKKTEPLKLRMWSWAEFYRSMGNMSEKEIADVVRVCHSGKETTKDSAENVKAGAIKYDAGKAPIFRGGLAYFPRAIAAVSEVSNFGASKYAWKGWENVPDGINRYSDAMVRHLAYEGKGEVLDPDSGLLHAAHCAWNSLARLELMLKEQDAVHQAGG